MSEGDKVQNKISDQFKSQAQQFNYTHQQKINKEGVYYVSFLYEIIDQVKLEKEKIYGGKNYDWYHVDENLKYKSTDEEDDLMGANRRMLKSKWYSKQFGTDVPPPANSTYHETHDRDFMKQPHLIVTGHITLKNSHGYLSAHQYIFISIHAWLTFTFIFLSTLWSYGLYKYKSKILKVHYMVSIVLYACMIEQFLTWILYELENNNEGSFNGFWIFISFMEVVRSVFSRVIVLLTALG